MGAIATELSKRSMLDDHTIVGSEIRAAIFELIDEKNELYDASRTLTQRTEKLESALQAMYGKGQKQGWKDNYPTEMAAARKALDNAPT